jgi:hypothetical protein
LEDATVSNQYNGELLADMVRLGKPFCAEDNIRLYPLVAAGDREARKQMIEGNMSLAIAKVDSFIGCFPTMAFLRDDLVSAAFIGLVKAVNQMAEGCQIKQPDNWNPTDCIGAWINRELGELADTEALIRLPPRSKYRARANGEELKAPAVCNTAPERFETPSYLDELEVRDLIATCCTCDEERTFMAKREAGHTYAEVAQTINMPLTSTYVMATELDARLQRKLKAIRDE